MAIEIRKAEKRDCPSLLKLIQELAVYEKEPEAVTVSPTHFEEAGFGQSPVWWAFVATDNDQIIGFALYYIRYSTWKGKTVYLEDILVTDAYRHQGVGTLLFDAVVEACKELGLHRMNWQVLDWNTPAISFYQKYKTQFDAHWINCTLEV
jgi:GNAT superfamily N-acetyltransferase